MACAQFLPGTSSSFTKSFTSSASTASAAADWTGPVVGATAVQKSAGGLADTIKQGATFYVYASVADSGNPASGVASVTASVTNVATVATATMTAGSYTIAGTAYNYRTAQLTAKTTLASGSYSYSTSGTDAGGTAGASSSDTVTVDNAAFGGDNFTWTDGGTAGRFDTGDVLRYVYTKSVDPISIVAGWDGSSTTVKAAFYDAAVFGSATDFVAISNTALTAQIPVGTAYLGGDYVAASGSVVYNATMTANGNTVSVTLGTVASGSASLKTATTQALATWTTMANATDGAGNASSVSTINQFGAGTFAATNKTGGTAGKPEAGDKVTFTYTSAPLLSSLVSGWTSGSQTVTVHLTNNASLDSVTVYDSADTTQLPLGSVNLNGNHVSASMTFTGSTMTVTGNAVSITLGTASNAASESTDSTGHKPAWAPDDAVTDANGAGSSTIPTAPASTTVQF